MGKRQTAKYLLSTGVILASVAYTALGVWQSAGKNPAAVQPIATFAAADTPVVASAASQSAPPPALQASAAPAPAAAGNPPALNQYFLAPSQTGARQTSAPVTLASSGPTPAPIPVAATNSAYRDGSFTGSQADAYFGTVQVRAVIRGGKVTSVDILDYPSDRRRSQQINSYALPLLQSEVIRAQSANIDIVSGATLTSDAYARSLAAALAQAKA